MSGSDSRILIVGGSGYVGRRLFTRFGHNRAVATWYGNPFPGGVRFDPARDSLGELVTEHGPVSHGVLLHGMTRLDDCAVNPERAEKVNVIEMRALLEQMAFLGIKPVFASTDQVFDGSKGDYSEDDAPNPLNTYGKHKVMVEDYLTKLGIEHAVVRMPKICGVDADDGTTLSAWLKMMRAGKMIRVSENDAFSPVFIDDVTAGFMLMVDDNLSGCYHLSGSMSLSRAGMLAEFMTAMTARFGDEAAFKVQRCKAEDFAFLEKRPRNLSMNNDKFSRAAGWRPLGVREICERFVAAL